MAKKLGKGLSMLLDEKPKKAAPKKAAKKKLIEGKYSHKILLRLEEPEGNKMLQIMKDHNIKTFAGAIYLSLNSYTRSEKEIKILNDEIKELENKQVEMIETVSDYIAAKKRLDSLKLK